MTERTLMMFSNNTMVLKLFITNSKTEKSENHTRDEVRNVYEKTGNSKMRWKLIIILGSIHVITLCKSLSYNAFNPEMRLTNR